MKNEKANYLYLFTNISKFLKFMQANFICCHYNNCRNFNNEWLRQMIYYKFPERVIYGLLRDNISFNDLSAEVYIEYSSNYKKFA